LARLTLVKQATSFDLKAALSAMPLLDRIISSLSGRCEFDAENARGLVLSYLPRNAERLARQPAILLGEYLRLAEYFKDAVGV
jgi:hypothetical protein